MLGLHKSLYIKQMSESQKSNQQKQISQDLQAPKNQQIVNQQIECEAQGYDLISNQNVQQMISTTNYYMPNFVESQGEFQYAQMPVYGAQEQNYIRLINEKDKVEEKKIVALIVSFVESSSYDNLFTTVEQKSQQGTAVLVYSCSSRSISKIFKELKAEESESKEAKEIVKYMKQIDSDCVVFNWQCSLGYSAQSFPEGKNVVFQFTKFVLDRGHMCMFSDFSLKALISQWDSDALGPNPFKKIGETSAPFQLYFEKERLAACPSAQPQIVGEMAEGGKCHVEAMGGTIVYSANNKIEENNFYKMQVLTVAQSDCQCTQQIYVQEVNGKKGTAGHVLLTYKSGGHLLTSMGHWIELMKIDTSEHKLFEVAEKQYGSQFAEQMKYQYAQMNEECQREFISANAVNFVQNQAPCRNMASKKGS